MLADSPAWLIEGFIAVSVLAMLTSVGWWHAAQQVVRHRRKLLKSRKLLRMCESLTDFGVWQFDPATKRHKWSPGMFALFGLPPVDEMLPGDAETLLPDGGADLMRQVTVNTFRREPFTIDYRARRADGELRQHRIRASNRFASDGTVAQVFGIVMDVTEQTRAVAELEDKREDAQRLAEEAQRLALTDPLTGLPNRRQAMTDIDRAIISSLKTGEPLSLVVFDLDYFKTVNDTYGHSIGDKVLVRIADIARDAVRGSDMVSRIGGEEFVWLMPGSNALLAHAAAERLRWAIETGSGAGGLPKVTASVGYAAWAHGDSSLALFAKADAALYAAKGSGRNQVKMAA